MKKFFVIILCLTLIFTITTLLMACDNGNNPDGNTFYSQWMSYIEDDTKINKIAIPGTHDSGTWNIPNEGLETQGDTIGNHLDMGARYFDIRVIKKNDNLYIFHNPMPTLGMEFLPILQSIKAFLDKNPSEFLILDFQHFGGNSQNDIIKALEDTGLIDIAVKNNSDKSHLEYIDSLTLGDVRGKVIICWGSSEADNDKCEYLFRRNDDRCSLDGCSLDSLYIGNLHNQGSEYFINNAMPKYFEHILKKNKGLLILQGQLTPVMMKPTPKTLEESHSDNMNNFTRNLKDNAEYLDIVNIIMRDYFEADAEKANSILSLNYYKGIVKEQNKQEYAKNCQV